MQPKAAAVAVINALKNRSVSRASAGDQERGTTSAWTA
jgi:hypothetical protein